MHRYLQQSLEIGCMCSEVELLNILHRNCLTVGLRQVYIRMRIFDEMVFLVKPEMGFQAGD